MSNEFIVKCRTVDKVEWCFDIVAVFGNNVEQNFVFSTKSKQIEHVQFVSNLSKGRYFVRHCRQKRQDCCRNRHHCCQIRQQCRSYIRLCRKNRSTSSFDNVALTLLLVCTDLKRSEWHVLPSDHTFYLPLTHLSTNGMSHPAFTSQPRRITALWPVLISRPIERRRLSWPGWLVTY